MRNIEKYPFYENVEKRRGKNGAELVLAWIKRGVDKTARKKMARKSKFYNIVRRQSKIGSKYLIYCVLELSILFYVQKSYFAIYLSSNDFIIGCEIVTFISTDFYQGSFLFERIWQTTHDLKVPSSIPTGTHVLL